MPIIKIRHSHTCLIFIMWIPVIKIKRSHDHLIFIMGISILVRWHLYIEMAPCLTSRHLQVWYNHFTSISSYENLIDQNNVWYVDTWTKWQMICTPHIQIFALLLHYHSSLFQLVLPIIIKVMPPMIRLFNDDFYDIWIYSEITELRK